MACVLEPLLTSIPKQIIWMKLSIWLWLLSDIALFLTVGTLFFHASFQLWTALKLTTNDINQRLDCKTNRFIQIDFFAATFRCAWALNDTFCLRKWQIWFTSFRCWWFFICTVVCVFSIFDWPMLLLGFLVQSIYFGVFVTLKSIRFRLSQRSKQNPINSDWFMWLGVCVCVSVGFFRFFPQRNGTIFVPDPMKGTHYPTSTHNIFFYW